jgi:hypothetical protein
MSWGRWGSYSDQSEGAAKRTVSIGGLSGVPTRGQDFGARDFNRLGVDVQGLSSMIHRACASTGAGVFENSESEPSKAPIRFL